LRTRLYNHCLIPLFHSGFMPHFSVANENSLPVLFRYPVVMRYTKTREGTLTNLTLRPSHSSSDQWPVSYLPRRSGFDPGSSHLGSVADKVRMGLVSSEYFGSPSQFSIHHMLHIHLSSGAGTIGQLVADVPSGLSLTPPHKTYKKYTILATSFKVSYYFGLSRSYCPPQF
jgi:hypothetical protein